MKIWREDMQMGRVYFISGLIACVVGAVTALVAVRLTPLPIAPAASQSSMVREQPIATGPTPNLRWAREIAEGYLRSASRDFFSDEALAWAAPAFHKRVNQEGTEFRYYHFKSWDNKSQELSPGGDEAIFRGTVEATRQGSFRPGRGGGSVEFSGSVPFTLRVSKSAEGKWQVVSMQFESASAGGN